MSQDQEQNREWIMGVVRRKGFIRVSHRYRDDRLRARCKKLVRDGLLFKMPYWMVRKRCNNDDPRSASFYALAQPREDNG